MAFDMQTQRDLRDRADVLRHVFAGLAVAASRCLREHPMLVAQVDREAVELQLRCVLDRRIRFTQRQLAPHPRIESLRAARLGVGLGADRQHRHRVTHRREAVEHPADDALGRRISGEQFRIRGLDRLQLLEHPVVFRIGHFRLVEHVVAMGVVAQPLAQFSGTRRRIDRLVHRLNAS